MGDWSGEGPQDGKLGGNVLLVWHEIPESIRLFILHGGSEVAELAMQSSGKYINCDRVKEGDPIDLLNNWIENNHALQVPSKQVIYGPFDAVIVCGFYL